MSSSPPAESVLKEKGFATHGSKAHAEGAVFRERFCSVYSLC